MKYLLTLVLFVMSTIVTSQNFGKIKVKAFMSTIGITNNYEFHSSKKISIDTKKATLTRFQGNTMLGLGGEHFSFIIAENEFLKGFVYFDKTLIKGELPNKGQAEQIVNKFLGNYAVDLLEDKELHWIKPHNEVIVVNEKEYTITGMKVKMRNPKTGLWFWVIIGKNHKPIVFERDVVWLNFKSKRQTEKWLHDSWLINKE